jgi:hypothetical protein
MDTKDFGHRTDRGWHFTDTYTLGLSSHSKEELVSIKDSFASPQSSNALVIKIAATHAGYVTRNNGIYLPDKMKVGASSWTDSFHKPILTHHEGKQDPIGRVIAATYIDLSSSVSERFKGFPISDNSGNRTGHADRSFWEVFTSERTSFMTKVDMIKTMDGILRDPNYQGVGYLELTAQITESEAIKKILDGRYITGSVGVTSDRAVCSICKTDWVTEEDCGHRPGEIYDGVKCKFIAGKLDYEEWSFVNKPADKFSKVIKVEQVPSSQMTDSADRVIKYFTVFTDSTKEDSIVSDQTNEDNSSTQSNSLTTDELLNKLVDKLFTDSGLSSEEEDKLYELQLLEMDKTIIEDAKLSPESRKKLPVSTFCGPKRSFPVNDCAHVAAARHLIDRYTGTNDKTAILSSIDRKARALGCESADETVTTTGTTQIQDQAKVPETEEPVLQVTLTAIKGKSTPEEKAKIASEILDNLVDVLGKEQITKAVLDSKLASDPQEVTSLLDEVTKYETTIGDLRGQLSVLRKELKAAYTDMTTVEDQLIASKEIVRSTKTEKIKLLHTLEGTLTDEVNAQILTFNDESLDTTIKNLSSRVDINKIVDKLNSGLSRIPEGKVEQPVGLTDTTDETKPNNKPTFANQQMVDEVYRRTLLSKGQAAAAAFYSDAVKNGLAISRQ